MGLTCAEGIIMTLLLICKYFYLIYRAIDVTLPHNGDSVKLTFGSTLDEEPCNESFGIDDVMIYVK
jgi:hypothetical protein